MSILSLSYWAEPLFMAVALFALWRSKEHKRFPALFLYFVLRMASYVVFSGLTHAQDFVHVSGPTLYLYYFLSYWSTYMVGAIVIFFVIQELFKSAMEPLPGLKRLGSIAFRWVACVSFVAAFAAMLTPRVSGYGLIVSACGEVMRCESIFILCLLFFLMVSAGRLGLSYRSRIFGVCFGFGVMAASNLITSALLLDFAHLMLHSTISAMDTGAGLVSMTIWAAFFLMKEPVRQPVSLPVTSSLVRWNDIATALGTSGRAAVPAPANDFFLQDVEKVVDRILTKNSLNVAS